MPVSFNNAKRAIEVGDIKWEVKLLRCIGFDTELYGRLAETNGSLWTFCRNTDLYYFNEIYRDDGS